MKFLPSLMIGIVGLFLVARVSADQIRDDQWREDLDYFQTTLPGKCIDFYKLMPKDRFDSQIADIRNSIPQLTDQEIALRLDRIIAGLGVDHAWIEGGKAPFHHYPLELHWFSDALVVTAAAPEYKDALGARVLQIGPMTPDQLEPLLAPYIQHENSIWLHARSAHVMTLVEILRMLGITGPDQRLQLTLVKLGGKPFTLWVSPPTPNSTTVSLEQTLQPLYTTHHSNYWYQYLAGTKTLYVQYSNCSNDPQYPFKDFARDLFAFADSHPVARIVVDLRFNSGGNSSIGDPLVAGIRSRPALNAKGHFYVLIGPMTVSSGEWMAEEFHNSFVTLNAKVIDGFTWVYPTSPAPSVTPFNATFVGEPTGGKPNQYGEVEKLQLPNSKISIAYPVKYFQLTTGADPPTRQPDILVAPTWQDFLAGRDPVLETVLHEPLP
jgi:hypothetical protein